jgi:hypothetical protein
VQACSSESAWRVEFGEDTPGTSVEAAGLAGIVVAGAAVGIVVVGAAVVGIVGIVVGIVVVGIVVDIVASIGMGMVVVGTVVVGAVVGNTVVGDTVVVVAGKRSEGVERSHSRNHETERKQGPGKAVAAVVESNRDTGIVGTVVVVGVAASLSPGRLCLFLGLHLHLDLRDRFHHDFCFDFDLTAWLASLTSPDSAYWTQVLVKVLM